MARGSLRDAITLTPRLAKCALCESLVGEDPCLPDGWLDRSGNRQTTVETVVDTLGFCGHHGVSLTRGRELTPTLAAILRDATERTVEMLRDEKRYAERLREIFFSTEPACAMCKALDHRFVQRTRRLAERADAGSLGEPLCFPHYRAVTGAVRSQALPSLVGTEREFLDAVVAAVGPIASGPHARTEVASLGRETLRWALGVVAGDASGWVEHAVPYPGDDPSCPVCWAVVRAGERWVDAVRTAARLGQDLWTVFPTCPTHVSQCVLAGDESAAVLAVRYAADVQLSALRRGTAALAHDNEQRAVARRSVFYRRQSPAYVLGQQRKMVNDVPRCPGCERLFVARDRAIGNLVQHVRAGRRRAGTVGTPCLKHFAAVYLVVPEGETRAMLVAAQIERLQALHDLLAAAADTRDSAPEALSLAAVREGMRLWSAATPPRASVD